MTAWVLAAPLVTALALAAGSARLVRALPPATAVRLLVGSALVTAVAGGFMLAVAAFSVLALNPTIAELGHWSVRELQLLSPLPWWAGVAALALVVPLFLAAVARTIRGLHQLWTADVTCRRLGPGVDGLIVVDDEHPEAYALQGLRGRTVVSTGMLAALSPKERRVLLAHEASHLQNRHPLLVLLADVAAAANPLLARTASAVRLGVERWADEDAATAVHDRELAARALARAALATHACGTPSSRTPRVALAMTTPSVGARAAALLAPAPRQRRVLAGAVLAITMATGTSAMVVARTTEAHFERAQKPVTASTMLNNPDPRSRGQAHRQPVWELG